MFEAFLRHSGASAPASPASAELIT